MSDITWHRIGSREDVRRRVPFEVQIEKHSVAIFFHEGKFFAISNVCNHKGGPLADGTLNGEYVTCPWHAWVYSIKTGTGEPGYEDDAVPAFDVEERDGDRKSVV